MTVNKIEDFLESVDDTGEILKWYIPELILNTLLAPKDRTFHHVVHTGAEMVEELKSSFK